MSTNQKSAEIIALRPEDAPSSRQMADFMGLLAHDLRNPLSAMNNALKLLEFEQCVSERGIRALKLLAMQIQRLKRLADTVEDVAELQKGQLRLRRERFDATEPLWEVARRAAEMTEISRHRLVVELPSDQIPIQGDRARLEQVISNLILNAIKYTLAGGEIHLKAEVVGGKLKISVRDTGLGLTPELKAKIFNPFVEVAEPDKKGQRINLALIKVLVERQGGTIDVRSEGPGTGTEFVVELPLEGSAQDTSDPARPLRILLADDDADAVELFTLLLGEKGYEVRSALDGATALRVCREFEPDVILLDISLPDMSGFDLARRLRELDMSHRAVLVALSGYSQEFLTGHHEGREFDYFLTKSFKFDNVIELLASLAEERRSGRAS